VCVKEYSTSQKENRRKHYTENLELYLWRGAQARAKKQGVPFTITLEDIKIPDRCPALGIPLYVGNVICSDNSPSLDKHEAALGYVKGNINVISFLANTMKSSGTLDDLRALVAYMEEKENEHTIR